MLGEALETWTDARAPDGALEIAPAPLSVPAAEARWQVLHTMSRQEKAVARALAAAGVRHYLPLVRRVVYRRCGRRTVRRPLFSSCLFMHGPPEAICLARATGRVTGVIFVPEQDRLVRELRQIRFALGRGAALWPHRYLAAGRRVRVRAGALEGLEGLRDERHGDPRLVLQVTALARAAGLEVDAGLLEPLD